MFDSHREADVTVGNTGRMLVLDGKLRMRGRRRMNRQAAGIADVGDMVEELQPVDETASGLTAACQFEADEAAEPPFQIFVGALARDAALHGGMNDLNDFRPFAEESS